MSIALLVMYMWAHGQVKIAPDTIYGQRIYCAISSDGKRSSGCTQAEVAAYKESIAQDVPAVQRWIHNNQWIGSCSVGTDKGVRACTAAEAKQFHTGDDLKWTCTDKSRILLTAEDGSKHCVKFGAR